MDFKVTVHALVKMQIIRCLYHDFCFAKQILMQKSIVTGNEVNSNEIDEAAFANGVGVNSYNKKLKNEKKR